MQDTLRRSWRSSIARSFSAMTCAIDGVCVAWSSTGGLDTQNLLLGFIEFIVRQDTLPIEIAELGYLVSSRCIVTFYRSFLRPFVRCVICIAPNDL